MALLFIEGFDHMAGSVGLTAKWAQAPGAITTAAARTGPGGIDMSGTGITKVFPAAGGFVVGAAFKVPGTNTWGSYDLLQVREGATTHLTLSSNGSSRICVKRGATILGTGTIPLLQNNWYYFELKGVIDDVAGSYEARIDGVTDVIGTGATRNGGATGQWDRLATTGSSHQFDDLYVCDLSGTANKDFLGSCKVETILPLIDGQALGTNRGLTPSTGTDHGAVVDETSPNTTDYNSSATIGVKDTYRFPALTIAGAVFGVQTNLYAAKSDVGARTLCTVVRAGGADFDGPTVTPLTTFAFYSRVWPVNPATGLPWTQADLAVIEAGMKVVS